MIVVGGHEFKTLDNRITVGNQRVKKAYAGNVMVYPEYGYKAICTGQVVSDSMRIATGAGITLDEGTTDFTGYTHKFIFQVVLESDAPFSFTKTDEGYLYLHYDFAHQRFHFDAIAKVETTGIPTATGVYYKPTRQSSIGPCTLIVAASDFGMYPVEGLRLSGEKVITSQSLPDIDSDSEYPVNVTVYGDSISYGQVEYSQTTRPPGHLVANYYNMFSATGNNHRGFFLIPDSCEFVMGRCNVVAISPRGSFDCDNPDMVTSIAYYPREFSSVGAVRVHLTDAVFISDTTE